MEYFLAKKIYDVPLLAKVKIFTIKNLGFQPVFKGHLLPHSLNLEPSTTQMVVWGPILNNGLNYFLKRHVYLIFMIKFKYSEKATKFCEISTLILSAVHTDKSKVEILQNFVAFSEYMNFNKNTTDYYIFVE